MLLDLSNPMDREKARTYLSKLEDEGAKIELTKKNQKRTVRQNAYLHAIFSLFGIEFGYSKHEVKQLIFKREVNRDMFEIDFINKETGEVTTDYQSTADMDTATMTQSIERFRNYSAGHGLYIPTSEEYIENKFYIDQQIEQNKKYL